MKTAAIAATLALGLSLSGVYAQNANDRPGMTAPRKVREISRTSRAP